MNPKTKIRYAVVGLGHIAQNAVLPAFQNTQNSELAALITGEREKAGELSKRYGVPSYGYGQFEAALNDEAVDAVFIYLPNSMHREYTERAAAAGKHVLCEKPMATTEAECKAMIETCAHANVRLMIAFRLHFTDAHLRAITLAKEGELGELRYFNSLFAMQVQEGNIRVRSETGGGPLYDIGIYCLNASRYQFQSEPMEVLAASTVGKPSRPDSKASRTCASSTRSKKQRELADASRSVPSRSRTRGGARDQASAERKTGDGGRAFSSPQLITWQNRNSSGRCDEPMIRALSHNRFRR